MTGIAHVVNVDVPQTPEDYVHRLGRAGKSDAVGDAFTLMSPEEQKDLEAIEAFLGRAIPRVLLPDFDYGMQPGELRRVTSYDENGDQAEPRARKAGGLQTAAHRIAAVPRLTPVAGGATHARPLATAATPAARPRPAASRAKVRAGAGGRAREARPARRASPAARARRHGR
jgi:ATP-dependent RNA helicase RhlE